MVSSKKLIGYGFFELNNQINTKEKLYSRLVKINQNQNTENILNYIINKQKFNKLLKQNMDSITQATLGAAVGQAVLGEKMGNKVKYDTPYEWFLDTVVNGYKREMAGGTVNVMPGQGDVVDVMKNIDGIYGYIAAMAEGKLTTTNRPGKGWKIK